MTQSPPPPVKIDTKLFELTDEGMTPERKKAALANLQGYVDYHQHYFLGYQANEHVRHKDTLANFLNVHLNNIGDPFTEGNFKINTKFVERHVLDYFARLWHAKLRDNEDPTQVDKEAYWGYVVSMGSTEGNLYAIRNARDYLSGRALFADKKPSKVQAMIAQGVAPPPMSHPSAYAYCVGCVNSNMTVEDVHARSHYKPLTSRVFQGRFQPSVPAHPPEEATLKKRWDIGDEVRASNACTPILFYSDDTHYSISKIKDIISIPTFYERGEDKYPGKCPLDTKDNKWPKTVPSNEDGSINIDKLALLVEFFAERGYPIAVCFNYGTTFKGAYDDVPKAIDKLLPILKRYGLYERKLVVEVKGETVESIRTGFWFHVDGALGSAHCPYLERSGHKKYHDLPKADFRQEIHSISVSGHKQMGSVAPCGLFMTKVKYLLDFASVAYIAAQDSTLSGSRSGFSALAIWDFLSKHTLQGLIDRAVALDNLAGLAYDLLKKVQHELNQPLMVDRSNHGLTVRFRQPSDHIIDKYSLSCDEINGVKVAHMFAMEQVTEAVLLQFANEYKEHFTLHPVGAPIAVPQAALAPAAGPAPRLFYAASGGFK